MTALADPVGRGEIATRAGVTRRAVDEWRRRHPAFPAPAVVISGAPLWEWQPVLDWLVTTGRMQTYETPGSDHGHEARC